MEMHLHRSYFLLWREKIDEGIAILRGTFKDGSPP